MLRFIGLAENKTFTTVFEMGGLHNADNVVRRTRPQMCSEQRQCEC